MPLEQAAAWITKRLNEDADVRALASGIGPVRYPWQADAASVLLVSNNV